MLHLLKRIVAKQTTPVRGINPGGEFLHYKNRLSTIKKNLQYIDRRMEDAIKYWKMHITQQRNLSERFSNSYPIRGDDTDEIAKEFLKGSTAVSNYFLRSVESEEDPYKNMHAQVKAHIKEIVNVEQQYRELLYIKSEAERYQAKVDSMDRRGKKNDLKRTRNLQKMDHEKLKLSSMTKMVLSAQKNAYAKAPTVYKAALCSYWSAYERRTEVMMANMAKISDFAARAREELGKLDISQMLLLGNTEEETEATADQIGRFSEARSPLEALVRHRSGFVKVPSILPKSPGGGSTSEDDVDLGMDTEIEEIFVDAVAV